DDERGRPYRAAEEVPDRVPEPYVRRGEQAEQPRQRQIDVLDLSDLQRLTEPAQRVQLPRGDRQRHVGAQRPPSRPVQFDIRARYPVPAGGHGDETTAFLRDRTARCPDDDGMLHLRAITPAGRIESVVAALDGCPGVTNLVVLGGAARRPEGDLVEADVARETVNDV